VTPAAVTPVPAPTGGRRLARWSPWIALVVVVAIALAIGSQRHSHPTLEQRTMSIAGAVRCPVCVGETAAESDVPASVEIRNAIRQDLQAGESRAEILSHLSAAYGPSILEKPPAQGINLLLWVLPALAVLAAVTGLVLAFLRWRPARVSGVSDDDRRLVGRLLDAGPGVDGGSRAAPPGGAGAPPPVGGPDASSSPASLAARVER
jgi:cytochrome c-type biogenesis protein CcmH